MLYANESAKSKRRGELLHYKIGDVAFGGAMPPDFRRMMQQAEAWVLARLDFEIASERFVTGVRRLGEEPPAMVELLRDVAARAIVQADGVSVAELKQDVKHLLPSYEGFITGDAIRRLVDSQIFTRVPQRTIAELRPSSICMMTLLDSADIVADFPGLDSRLNYFKPGFQLASLQSFLAPGHLQVLDMTPLAGTTGNS